jgi:hypothetical protein
MSGTATLELTWPTDEEIEKVSDAISKGLEELELLVIRAKSLVGEDLSAGAPTLEDIGRVYAYTLSLDSDLLAFRDEQEDLQQLLIAMDSVRLGHPSRLPA